VYDIVFRAYMLLYLNSIIWSCAYDMRHWTFIWHYIWRV